MAAVVPGLRSAPLLQDKEAFVAEAMATLPQVQVQEEVYIPLALARNKLISMYHDWTTILTEQQQALEDVYEAYRTIEVETARQISDLRSTGKLHRTPSGILVSSAGISEKEKEVDTLRNELAKTRSDLDVAMRDKDKIEMELRQDIASLETQLQLLRTEQTMTETLKQSVDVDDDVDGEEDEDSRLKRQLVAALHAKEVAETALRVANATPRVEPAPAPATILDNDVIEEKLAEKEREWSDRERDWHEKKKELEVSLNRSKVDVENKDRLIRNLRKQLEDNPSPALAPTPTPPPINVAIDAETQEKHEKQISDLQASLEAAHVEAERLKQTVNKLQSAEIPQDGPRAETTAAIEALEEERAGIRQQLSEWRDEFREREGRDPSKEDRMAIRPLLERFKEADGELKSLQQHLSGLPEEEVDPKDVAHRKREAVLMARIEELEEELKKESQEKQPSSDDTHNLGELEEKLTASQESEEALKKQIAELQSRLDDAMQSGVTDESAMKALELARRESLVQKEHAGGLAEALSSLSEQYDILRDRAHLAEAEAAKANAMLADSREEGEGSDEVATLRDSLDTEVKRGEEQAREMAVKMQEKEDETLSLRESVTKLQSELDAAREGATGNTSKLEAELTALNEQVTSMKQSLEESEDQVKTLTASLEDANQRANDTEKQLEAAKSSASGDSQKLQSELSSLRQSLDEAVSRGDNAETDVARLNGELDSAREELNKLKNDNTELNTKLQSSGESQGRKVTAMQNTIRQNTEEIETLKKKLHDSETQSAEKIQNLRTELDDMKEGTSASNSEYEATIKKLKGHVTDLEAQLSETRDKMSQATGEMETRLADSEAQCKQLTTDLEDARQQIATLQSAAEESGEEITRLTALAQDGAEMATKCKNLESKLVEIDTAMGLMSKSLKEESSKRKKYYNMIEDLKGKIRVYCRVRPMSKKETGEGYSDVTNVPDEYSIVLKGDGERPIDKEYVYDEVFTPKSSQAKVFEDCEALIQSAFDGYNVCIFAYGQTGSGKTYTIHGEGDQPGLSVRAITRIYELVEENKAEYDCRVSCYLLELYNDQLMDMFHKPSSEAVKLKIKMDPKTLMVFVQGAIERSATSAQSMLKIMEDGTSNRHTAETMMNADSSRSHLVFSVLIRSKHRKTGVETMGKLSLVDLAGSERVGKTGAAGQTLREAQSINKSLAALGNVISALSTEAGHIPYRNNPLTLLLMDSLGGNAKTLMFVNVSPSSYNREETLNTLDYGRRAKMITNMASKNVENKQIRRLNQVIEYLLDASEEGSLTTEQEDELNELLRLSGNAEGGKRNPSRPRSRNEETPQQTSGPSLRVQRPSVSGAGGRSRSRSRERSASRNRD